MTESSPGDLISFHSRAYDYCLKFLLVGDSDVGKNEILNLLDGESEAPGLCTSISPKTTFILLEGKRVKLQLWDTSGQGRFATIIRSYSRGAQGVLVVYDITNHWSFEGINRWLKEIDEQAPGIPKILIGNRLHLEFRRQVSREEAGLFAKKKNMEYFEVSTLALFTVCESFTELSRLVLTRNGMERLWKNNKVLPLQELCCRCIAPRLRTVHDIDRLPLPLKVKFELKSFAGRDQCTIPCDLHRKSRPLTVHHSHSKSGQNGVLALQRYKRTRSDLLSNNCKPKYQQTEVAVAPVDTAPSSLVSPLITKFKNRRHRATVTLPRLSTNQSNDTGCEVLDGNSTQPHSTVVVDTNNNNNGNCSGQNHEVENPVHLPNSTCPTVDMDTTSRRSCSVM